MALNGLQIYGNPPPALPEELVENEEEPQMKEPATFDGGTVSMESARYFGPEGRCKNCAHFFEPSSCEIVGGDIDPEGICSLFSADTEGMALEPVMEEEDGPTTTSDVT